MTADVHAGAGGSPFGINASAVGNALRTFAANRSGVAGYVDAMRGVELGVQRYDVAGLRGEYDPFGNLQTAVAALRSAQHHTDPVADALTFLHMWASKPDEVISVITGPLEKVKGLLAAAGPSGTFTDAQAVEAHTQVYLAAIFTRQLASGHAQIGNNIATFIGSLSADHEALSNGVAKVVDLRARVLADGQAASQRYIFDPMTRPIGEMIARLAGKVADQLGTLGGNLLGALLGHAEMRGALTAMATAADAAASKCEDARNSMGRMDRAGLTIAAREARLEVALDSWKEYSDFFRNSGL
jgi:hypothetical protein